METHILNIDFKYPIPLNACSPTVSNQVSVYRKEINGEFAYIGSNTGEVGGFLTETALISELMTLGAQIRHICRLE